MKERVIVGFGAFISTIFVLCLAEGAQAKNLEVVCSEYGGHPTTIVRTKDHDKPLIQWTDLSFEKSGYSPQVRCSEVSERLAAEMVRNSQIFLRTGIMNNLSVICFADERGGPCTSLFYTMKKGQDAEATLEKLLSINIADVSSGTMQEASCPAYVRISSKGNLKSLRACAPQNWLNKALTNVVDSITDLFEK